MLQYRQQPPTRRSPRPWVLPPARIHRPDGYVRGKEILAEIPGPLGVLLWMLHRDVELWAGTPPARRPELFKLAALRSWCQDDLPNHLREAVPALIESLAGMSSEDATGPAAAACTHIAAWTAADAPRTALLFAEAAARLEPSSASIARDVARFAVRCSLPGAESWLKRAMALGRRARDWAQYGHALADMAELRARRGERDRAHRGFIRARRMYHRYRLPRAVRARAEVGLLRIALENGASEEIEAQTRRSLRTYRYDDPASVAMRIEVARALIERRRFARALRILHVDGLPTTHAERVQLANLATAAESLARADEAAVANEDACTA